MISNLLIYRNWAAANGFAILLIIYFLSTVCLILLAISVYYLSRRMERVAGSTRHQAHLLDKFTKEFDEYMKVRAKQNDCSTSEREGTAGVALELPIPAESVREELESLIADLAPEIPPKSSSFSRR